MAIKILKHGKKQKFTKTCPDCGCEFEYEIEDLKTDYSICLTSYPGRYNRYVLCPECGFKIIHDTIMNEMPRPLDIIYTNNTDPCEGCINKDGPKDAFGNPVAGDSPCQWCPNSKTRVTCNVSEKSVTWLDPVMDPLNNTEDEDK